MGPKPRPARKKVAPSTQNSGDRGEGSSKKAAAAAEPVSFTDELVSTWEWQGLAGGKEGDCMGASLIEGTAVGTAWRYGHGGTVGVAEGPRSRPIAG